MLLLWPEPQLGAGIGIVLCFCADGLGRGAAIESATDPRTATRRGRGSGDIRGRGGACERNPTGRPMEWESDRDRRLEPHMFARNLFIYFQFHVTVCSFANHSHRNSRITRATAIAMCCGPAAINNVGATFSAMCFPSAAIHSSPARILWGITLLSVSSNFDHSPSITSFHALPPGSPGDSLRGIQRRASGHKSAARRFLHKLQCDRRHPFIVTG